MWKIQAILEWGLCLYLQHPSLLERGQCIYAYAMWLEPSLYFSIPTMALSILPCYQFYLGFWFMSCCQPFVNLLYVTTNVLLWFSFVCFESQGSSLSWSEWCWYHQSRFNIFLNLHCLWYHANNFGMMTRMPIWETSIVKHSRIIYIVWYCISRLELVDFHYNNLRLLV